ncbi:MAG: MTH938/NDUFAF3 family protein [Candidatus Marinimicrobia bacterium]|nr:MTH938/NDUFAF3 family protein [Candidatus Neomarinimicrobiota bacterium]
MTSPRITSLKWGSVKVDGFGTFRDVKLFPGGAREWNWQETGTRHSPGIQPADVQEIIDAGARTVVLSSGMYKRLKTMPETVASLKKESITIHQLQTEESVTKYNNLCEEEQVGSLIHTTC